MTPLSRELPTPTVDSPVVIQARDVANLRKDALEHDHNGIDGNSEITPPELRLQAGTPEADGELRFGAGDLFLQTSGVIRSLSGRTPPKITFFEDQVEVFGNDISFTIPFINISGEPVTSEEWEVKQEEFFHVTASNTTIVVHAFVLGTGNGGNMMAQLVINGVVVRSMSADTGGGIRHMVLSQDVVTPGFVPVYSVSLQVKRGDNSWRILGGGFAAMVLGA